ncbi:MAG: sigma factor-like helix-turn-helix DNA-binding protein, partial [Ktedonobacterales bacterium]
RQAVNALPEDLRLVVVLRFYGGMGATEIGAAIGIPAGTVRTRLKRALSALRDDLRDASEIAERALIGNAGEDSHD